MKRRFKISNFMVSQIGFRGRTGEIETCNPPHGECRRPKEHENPLERFVVPTGSSAAPVPERLHALSLRRTSRGLHLRVPMNLNFKLLSKENSLLGLVTGWCRSPEEPASKAKTQKGVSR
jgi:hypothetical protein